MPHPLKLAPLGSILVTYGDNPDQPSGLQGWLLRRAYAGIRQHQRALFHDHKSDGVHIQIKVGTPGFYGQWVSATIPRVVEHYNPIGTNQKYRLYHFHRPLPEAATEALVAYARFMVGQPYDTLQLVGIAASEQKWIPKFMRNWLGERLQLPGRKEVCSTLAARAYEAAHIVAKWQDPDFPPPLTVDPFDCTPAHFEHSPNFILAHEQL